MAGTPDADLDPHRSTTKCGFQGLADLCGFIKLYKSAVYFGKVFFPTGSIAFLGKRCKKNPQEVNLGVIRAEFLDREGEGIR